MHEGRANYCPGKTVIHKKAVINAFVVTWFNPQALVDGTMMLGAFNSILNPASYFFFMEGVSAASLLWFPGLTTAVHLFRQKLGNSFFQLVNRVCDIIIIFYGCKLLFDFLYKII